MFTISILTIVYGCFNGPFLTATAIIVTQAAPLAISMASAGDVQYLVFAMITAAAAIAIPPCQLFLKHEGSILTETFQGRLRALNWPEFLNRIAFGGYLGAIIISVLVVLKDAVWLRFGPPSQRAQLCTRWPPYEPQTRQRCASLP